MAAGTNDFLPFGIGGGANVLSQAAYAGLGATITNGYLSGTAVAQQLNKTWRQGTVMAAVMAQLACDQSLNMADDGVTATQVANMKTAIKGLRAGAVKTITTTPVNLTAADSGIVFIDATGGNRVVNLPACNVANGQPLEYNFIRTDATANSVTINRAGADTIDGAASFVLQGSADKRSIVGDGSAAWYTLGIPGNGNATASLIGASDDASMIITAASASGTFTASEVVMQAGATGQTFKVAGYSKTINLATTGAGGMDTGGAPVSGYVALYAIYNPSSGAISILACNANTLQGKTYGGANMPAGYTHSALIAVCPTNASSQFKVLAIRGKKCLITVNNVHSSSTPGGVNLLNISTTIPPNALAIDIRITVANSAATNSTYYGIHSDLSANWGSGPVGVIGSGADMAVTDIQILTPQTVWWTLATSAGTPTGAFGLRAYRFM